MLRPIRNQLRRGVEQARAEQRKRKLVFEQLESRQVCAAFQADSLAVYRVGDGVSTLNSAGTPVFVDEYSPSGTLIQSIALPTTNDGLNRKLVASGAFGFYEGLMTRSTDGKFLVMTGYDAAPGTPRVRTTDSATNNRVIGRIDGKGLIDTTTALTDSPSSDIHSVASTNGTDFWYTGLSTNGLRFTTLGATTGNQINTGANSTGSVNAANIFDGQLYLSSLNFPVASVGTGLPTTAGQNTTPLPGLTSSPFQLGSPYQFYLADLTGAVPGVDTLYFADGNQGIVAPGGIWKFSLVGGTWVYNGVTIGTLGEASSATGLTGTSSGSTVSLVGTSQTKLFKLVDTTGYNGTWLPSSGPVVTLIATTGPNKLFRSVAYAPISNAVELVVHNVVTTPSSLAVRFTKPIDTSRLNLVDSNNLNGASDMTIVGTTVGPIRGSMVLDADRKGFTFVKSGGVFPADSYSLMLRSAANGFMDLAGNLLDGNGDGIAGDNYVYPFVVTAPDNTVELSIPDFVRGPGQVVNLPANSTNGLPITISTGTNLRSVSFDLNYDPIMLTISGGTTSIAGATVSVDTATAGLAKIAVTSAAQFSGIAGPLALVNLTATVPPTATIGSKSILRLSNVRLTSVDGSVRASATDDGLQISAYKGDTNNSNSITTGDVTGLLRSISGAFATTGFPSFKLADAVVVGDMNESSSLTTGDATGLLRFISGAAGGFPAIPSLPSGLTPLTAADPQIFIPKNLAVNPGDSVIVPININVTDPLGVSVAGIDISLDYDANRFVIGTISLGPVLAGFTFSSSNNLLRHGNARLVLAAQHGPTLDHGFIGTLLNVTLIAKASAAFGSSAINLMGAGVSDNEANDLTIAPAITSGVDSSDGVITIKLAAFAFLPNHRAENFGAYGSARNHEMTRIGVESGQAARADFKPERVAADNVICVCRIVFDSVFFSIRVSADDEPLFVGWLNLNSRKPKMLRFTYSAQDV